MTIDGGVVTVGGGAGGAGIGGGNGTDGGSIRIANGKVSAAGCDILDGTDVAISGGLFAMELKPDWLARWCVIADNLDPATMGKYPYSVIEGGAVGENVTAYMRPKGVLEIVGTGAMYDFASAADVPWDPAKVTMVTVSDGVTRIGANAWAGLDDGVAINGTALSVVRYLAPGVSSAAPVESSGAVSANFEAVRIVGGVAYLDVAVCTNGDVTATAESWGKAKVEKAEVVDGEAILTVPATAEKGFMILKSKGAVPSDFKEPPTTIDVQH